MMMATKLTAKNTSNRAAKLGLVCVLCTMLQACVVLTIADVAASAVVKTAGLVVDGAVGTVRVVGGVVGAVLPGGSDKDSAKDTSKEKDKKK